MATSPLTTEENYNNITRPISHGCEHYTGLNDPIQLPCFADVHLYLLRHLYSQMCVTLIHHQSRCVHHCFYFSCRTAMFTLVRILALQWLFYVKRF